MEDTATEVRSDDAPVVSRKKPKPVGVMVREALNSCDLTELVKFVDDGGKIPSSLLAQVLRQARLVKKVGGQSGPRDLPKHCAAYLVSCCVDIYRNTTGKLPPREDDNDVLLDIAREALRIVHEHFNITEPSKQYQPSEIIGHKSTKTAAYQRDVHDEACLTVHSEMHEQLVALIDRQEEKYFARIPPIAPPL